MIALRWHRGMPCRGRHHRLRPYWYHIRYGVQFPHSPPQLKTSFICKEVFNKDLSARMRRYVFRVMIMISIRMISFFFINIRFMIMQIRSINFPPFPIINTRFSRFDWSLPAIMPFPARRYYIPIGFTIPIPPRLIRALFRFADRSSFSVPIGSCISRSQMPRPIVVGSMIIRTLKRISPHVHIRMDGASVKERNHQNK
jgi:hypothetical protein